MIDLGDHNTSSLISHINLFTIVQCNRIYSLISYYLKRQPFTAFCVLLFELRENAEAKLCLKIHRCNFRVTKVVATS